MVDPGVGTDRRPLVVEADGRLFIGPDNGLFEMVRRRAGTVRAWVIDWRPPRLSASFHGRDLFAPVTAWLALGKRVPRTALDPAVIARPDWPDELARIVYVDCYGNAMTGLRAASLPADAVLTVDGRAVRRARTFADAPPGAALWYENANGLAEIAVNRARADRALGLAVGHPVIVGKA